MAIINRTPDSFYDKGATFAEAAALDSARDAVAAGADILDIGGVKAGPGQEVTAAEEIARTHDFVAAVRAEFPDIVISLDTWRSEVADAVIPAGVDLVNDAWGGWDPALATVAGRHKTGLVCMHTGGAQPRRRPHRVRYEDVTKSALADVTDLADKALAAGVNRESILIDPGHDFGKNTYHSLQLTRDLTQFVDTGWPVLVSLSNKDFVGESLDAPVDQRLVGTLATTSVSAWLGAQVFRVHNVPETRQTLDMVATIKGTRRPTVARRGLA